MAAVTNAFSALAQPYRSGQSAGAQAQPYSGALGSTVAQPQARPAQTNPALAFSPTASLPQPKSPLQPLSTTDQVNPGYGEQALNYTQNRLLEDPFQGYQTNLANQASQPSAGQNYMDQNLGSLNGPGQGEQYWQGVQGQFQSPFAGEQYARQATQNFSPTGAAGAFNNQAQGQYNQFTNYQGAGNTQGQYGMSSGELAGGTYGENALNSIVGQYGSQGQYGGPNYSAGQYGATQASFGALPTPDSADPYYDRAIQLGTQAYNQGAAGRGVYGSSEALSGVGNVITDLNAARAKEAFTNAMSIAQENRARQQLLGEQARNSDLSGIEAFNANTSATQTYGNLANDAASRQLQRNELLGNMANNADTQATAAQNSNIQGLSTLGTIANNADRAETDRYTASTNAMNAADKTALDRLTSGADIANMADSNRRADYSASMGAAANAANADNARLSTASQIASTGSNNDLARVLGFNQAALGAEGQRQTRAQSQLDAVMKRDSKMADLIQGAQKALMDGDQQAFEDKFNTEIAPALQAAGYSQQEIDNLRDALMRGASRL